MTAELPGYQKPPRFYGRYGRAYIPDVYVFNRRLAYEVKEYWAYRYAVSKLNAISSAPEVDQLVLVLCSGNPEGVSRVSTFLEANGVDCEVINYREHPCWD